MEVMEVDAVDSCPRSKKDNAEDMSSVDSPPLPDTGNQNPELEEPPEKKENIFAKSYNKLLEDIKKMPFGEKHLERLESNDKITTIHTTYFPEEPVGSNENQNAIEADTNRFKMHYPKGVFTLVNMKASRNWSDLDAKKLVELFLALGFIVQQFDNPSSEEIDQIMEAAAECDFNCGKCRLKNRYCGASVCAVLARGDNQTFSSKDGDKKIQELVKKFRKTNLSDKPKIFIFQASEERDFGKSYDETDGKATEKGADYRMTLPVEADFLYVYSTSPGRVSWRDEKNGSWFIHHLDKVFRAEAGKLDVLRMLLKVNRNVKEDWESNIKSKTSFKDEKQVPSFYEKQVPSFVSQLRKDLYLDFITTRNTSQEE